MKFGMIPDPPIGNNGNVDVKECSKIIIYTFLMCMIMFQLTRIVNGISKICNKIFGLDSDNKKSTSKEKKDDKNED